MIALTEAQRNYDDQRRSHLSSCCKSADGIDADGPQEALGELPSCGAKLIIQSAVEEGFEAWLGRGRYGRKAEAAPEKRNG